METITVIIEYISGLLLLDLPGAQRARDKVEGLPSQGLCKDGRRTS